MKHFTDQGSKYFRIPFGWKYIQPQLFSDLNDTFFQQFDLLVQKALSNGAIVVIDVHNYARINGGIIGQGGPTNDAFADLWQRLASKYAQTANIIFGVMNEPHELDLTQWAVSVQAALKAIRDAGAKSQLVLLPGSDYSSINDFNATFSALGNITDYDGSNTRLIFDIHSYLDFDNSGTNAECIHNNVDTLMNVKDILTQYSRQAFLSETGGGNVDSCVKLMSDQMAFVTSNSDQFLGWVAWAAGSFSTDYVLSLTPFPDGSDQILWTKSLKSYLYST